jgi:SAM-dependent methyltransferase
MIVQARTISGALILSELGGSCRRAAGEPIRRRIIGEELEHTVTMSLGVRRILRRVYAGVRGRADSASAGLKPHRQRLQKYIAGEGIEIGALHNPMPTDQGRATVRYVDRIPLEDQRKHYPELSAYALVHPDIVAEADHLAPLGDGSQDFVIANHLLEHLPDPIGALKEWYRVLRSGGILFLALPDKRRTFDRDRPRTTLAHLIADHADHGAASRFGHCEEYSRLVHKKTGDALAADVKDLLDKDYSIHLHVWIPDDAAELLAYLRDAMSLNWRILEYFDGTGSDEFIYVLQKPA